MKTRKHVTCGETFRALEQAGHIKEPPPHVRPLNATWGSGSYVYVDEGPARSFTHAGRAYRVDYVDGCFYPLLYELT